MLIKPKKIQFKNVLPDVCKLYIFQPHVREVRPLTSDIIVCDCFHGNQCSLPLSVKPNRQVQSLNLCCCE